MSTQRMRDWMAAHPAEAANVRATNRSYMFFRVTGLSNEDEPIGAQGVPLTPGRPLPSTGCMNTDAVFHRSQSADREREARFTLPPPDDCAGYGSAIVGPAAPISTWAPAAMLAASPVAFATRVAS
jgi:membrane-bound lytic murein transglycosylase A